MTQPRKIDGIYHGGPVHWVGDGFRVTNYFPSANSLGQKISPYVLMDYHPPFAYPPSGNKRRGVGAHPHRGFETVTLAFEGSLAHSDSAGHAGIIAPGDVQWMTAARGVLHNEYHEDEFARTGGIMHMAQIWVNLPKAHKMDAPRYQSILAGDIGRFELAKGAGVVRVIAGEYGGVKGPASTFSPLNMFEVLLHRDGRVHFSFPAHENAGILVLGGAIQVNDEATAGALDFILFANEGEDIAVHAAAGARFLLLNGEPIDEPVVQYGPFVMNSQQEIRQAVIDFNSGSFGSLEN